MLFINNGKTLSEIGTKHSIERRLTKFQFEVDRRPPAVIHDRYGEDLTFYVGAEGKHRRRVNLRR